MTREEAKTAMKMGHLVSHQYFEAHEFVRFDVKDGKIVGEDGCRVKPVVFWADRQGEQWNEDWRIWTKQMYPDCPKKCEGYPNTDCACSHGDFNNPAHIEDLVKERHAQLHAKD